MNKVMVLIMILVVLIVFAILYFMNNSTTPTPTKIIKEGNTIEVPIDMITDGAPPDSAGGP
ncbi:MAG: hypothetical protein Q8P72_04245 [Candidatus Roizmanbacteria bacterium]|nr:hypothetical protein [Candidatus Roizmanbacteria bacterium]